MDGCPKQVQWRGLLQEVIKSPKVSNPGPSKKLIFQVPSYLVLRLRNEGSKSQTPSAHPA